MQSFPLQRNETFQEMYFKECMKQKSPNVFVCPDNENFKPNSNDTSFVTNLLQNLEEKFERKENKLSKPKKKERKKGSKEKLNRMKERKRKHAKKGKSK